MTYRMSTIILACILAGCATATQGTHEGVRVESEPPGAKAVTNILSSDSRYSVDGHLGCEPTPCVIQIPRKAEPQITVSLEGHQPITYKISSAVVTGSGALPAGTLIAGLPPSSHVRAGSADILNRLPSGTRVAVGGLMTYGIGTLVDVASGANRNLAPNPATVVLAPIEPSPDDTQRDK